MAETVSVALTSGSYSTLASGLTTVLILPIDGTVRLHIGSGGAPAAGSSDYFPLPTNEIFQADGLTGSDVVYARSEAATGEVKVLRK